jgi:HEAT repeat protein
LLELLGDEDIETRCQAIHALATLGAVGVLPQLVRLVKDPSKAVVDAARSALERIKSLQPGCLPPPALTARRIPKARRQLRGSAKEAAFAH